YDLGDIIDWTPAWSLIHQERRYLPTSYCYLQYKEVSQREICRANSNGCASGNVPEEAVLQGLLEIAERDAIALWWYNRLVRPAVSLDSFGGDFVGRTRRYFAERRRKLHVLDLTSDLKIPTFGAISYEDESSPALFGFGAHIDPGVALTRALTE